MKIDWTYRHNASLEHLGYIPSFLSDLDARPAAKQFEDIYIGGWRPFEGFKMLPNGDMKFSGDPPTRLLAETKLRDETIRFYVSAWVAVVQPDGSFEVVLPRPRFPAIWHKKLW